MKTIQIQGQVREGKGKKATRALRAQGLVPGVIYGGNEEIHFAAPVLSFRDLVYSAEFQIAEITVDGKTYKTILKDIQFDVVTDSLNHIDFLELVEDNAWGDTFWGRCNGIGKNHLGKILMVIREELRSL